MKRRPLVVVAVVVAGCAGDRALTPRSPEALPGVVTSAVVAPQVLVGAGDIAGCTSTGDEATAALLDGIPGTVFTTGDNAYPNGSPTDYANCYEPSWGRHRARTRPAPGNHEYNTSGAAGYFGYFGAAAGDPAKGYYSYDLGAWHVVVLNSSLAVGPTSPQLQWLRADLAASGAHCTIAYWHHARFSSGGHGSHPALQPAWQALYEAGAEIVVAGHDHNYERFAPQTPAGVPDPSHGIRQFVVGTGGAGSHSFAATPLPTSEVRHSGTRGVLKLTLEADAYAWEFVPQAGRTFQDAGAGSCHDAPAPMPNQPPVARPGGPYSTATGTLRLDAGASTDPDGDLPLAYRWDFGDGMGNDGVVTFHSWVSDGTYPVTLTVTDARGGSAAATTSVTVSGGGGPVSLILGGRIATCSSTNDDRTAALLDVEPGFAVALGDNASPSGSGAAYADCYQASWGRHRSRTWAALGDRDYGLGNADAAFTYFGARAGPRGLGYHSFDLGAWHIIVLNDNAGFVPFAAGSAQDQWLAADLAANVDRCILAVWHQPRFFSSGTPGWSSRPNRKVLWDRLYAAGADVVVNANEIRYERMARMRPDGTRDDVGGIRQFNVGTGGHGVDLALTELHPNSEARAAVHGVLVLTLRTGGYDWRFRAVPGATFTDAGSDACNGATAPNQPPIAEAGGPYATTDGVVRFDGSGARDPDGDLPLAWAWAFGDGATGTGATPTHTYAADGTYHATLRMTDARGAVSVPDTAVVTVARGGPAITLSGAGNIARCSNANADATARLLDALPGYVFTVGDHAYPGGTAASFAACYDPTWGRHKGRTVAVLGNGDYGPGTADAAFAYFGPGAGPEGLGYHSFDLGDWHVIVLNDNAPHVPFAAGSAQDQWLVGDLAANSRRCTIALWHQPRFFSSNTPGWTSSSSRKVLWNRLYAAGVDVVINGQQYHYERLAPMRPDGSRDDAAGIRSFIVGTGGEGLEPPVAIHALSEALVAEYGVLRLTLAADRYDWAFVPVGGQPVRDAGSGACH